MIHSRCLPRFLAVLGAITAIVPQVAGANTFDGRPKIVIHLASVTAKNQCAGGTLTDCAQAVTAGDLYPPHAYYAFLLIAKGNLPDVDSFDCGITYQGGVLGGQSDKVGVDIFSWHLCATINLVSPEPFWPAPGSSNIIIFHASHQLCATTETANGGYFYLGAYSPDVLRVTKRPVDDRAVVVNCAETEFELKDSDLGSVTFAAGGQTAGCNPCLALCEDSIPVKASSWSRVKALFTR